MPDLLIFSNLIKAIIKTMNNRLQQIQEIEFELHRIKDKVNPKYRAQLLKEIEHLEKEYINEKPTPKKNN